MVSNRRLVDSSELRAEIERLRRQRDEFKEQAERQMTIALGLRAALKELLSGHDNLYIAHFGPQSDPRDDIAAKAARSICEQ